MCFFDVSRLFFQYLGVIMFHVKHILGLVGIKNTMFHVKHVLRSHYMETMLFLMAKTAA